MSFNEFSRLLVKAEVGEKSQRWYPRGGFQNYRELEHLFRNGSQQGWRYGFSAQKGQRFK